MKTRLLVISYIPFANQAVLHSLAQAFIRDNYQTFANTVSSFLESIPDTSVLFSSFYVEPDEQDSSKTLHIKAFTHSAKALHKDILSWSDERPEDFFRLIFLYDTRSNIYSWGLVPDLGKSLERCTKGKRVTDFEPYFFFIPIMFTVVFPTFRFEQMKDFTQVKFSLSNPIQEGEENRPVDEFVIGRLQFVPIDFSTLSLPVNDESLVPLVSAVSQARSFKSSQN